MVHAFGYIRWSDDAQSEGDSLQRQTAAINEYAKVNGIIIDRVFVEDGVSGKVEAINRPAFNAMVGEMLGGSVKTVVAERLDRLARDLMVQETAIRNVFQKNNLTFISTKEPDLMSNDPQRKFIRVVLGAAAEMDRDQIVYKMTVAKQRIRASGVRCEGRKPFGAREGESVAIERMRALRNEGLGFDKISQIMNAEGVPTRNAGKKWHGWGVNQILQAQAA